MLSVMVLGLFETSMDRSTRGVKAWQQHINGAAALARMRGLGQFRTKAGIRSKSYHPTSTKAVFPFWAVLLAWKSWAEVLS